MSQSLQEFYEKLESRAVSSASDYAAKMEKEKRRKAMASIKFVTDVTKGATALDLYTTKVAHTTVVANQTEVLARRVLTELYGLQCMIGVLAGQVEAPFDPHMTNPSESTDTTVGRLEEALIAITRMSQAVRFVTGSVSIAAGVNTNAYNQIIAAGQHLTDEAELKRVLVSIDTNDYRDQAHKLADVMDKLSSGEASSSTR